MNDRERFFATMHYPRDRTRICGFDFWDQPIKYRIEQGLLNHILPTHRDAQTRHIRNKDINLKPMGAVSVSPPRRAQNANPSSIASVTGDMGGV